MVITLVLCLFVHLAYVLGLGFVGGLIGTMPMWFPVVSLTIAFLDGSSLLLLEWVLVITSNRSNGV